MKTMAGSVMALAFLALVAPAFAADKDPNGVPEYNAKTEVDFKGTVVKVREVRAGEAYAGVHLTMELKGQNLDVYLGPADFIKMMGVQVNEGDRNIGITGSKVKFEGADLVLARELRIGNMFLTLRNERGFPSWLWFTKPGITSGGL